MAAEELVYTKGETEETVVMPEQFVELEVLELAELVEMEEQKLQVMHFVQ